MPSPFPGVDPYLEQSPYWRGFHNVFIAFIMQALNETLPPGLAANSEERVYVLPQDRSVFPDLVVRRPAVPPVAGRGAAVLEPTQPDGEVVAFPEPQREAFIEIRSATDWERIIAVIEVLSPANKASGAGRDEYLAKQHSLLESNTHLMEIDPLRSGLHTVAAPLASMRKEAAYHGIVSLHRSSRRYAYEYWMLNLRDPLPNPPVPLSEGLADVALPLQACYDRAYDAGPYARMIDYNLPPPVPLPEADLTWLDAVLREQGLRA